MKKMITAWLLIAALLSLSITAYAQDQTTASMEITYEYTEPDDSGGNDNGGNSGGGESGDDGGDIYATTYTLNIPAHVSFTPNEAIPITATKNDIADGKAIVLTVDFDKTYDQYGQFFLYKNKGDVNEEQMSFKVWTYTDGTLSTLNPLHTRNARVATFTAGSLSPTYGGYMLIERNEGMQHSSGTYTGEIHFNINVVDE